MDAGGSEQKVLTRFVERLGRRHRASEKRERPDGARERRFVQAHVDKTTRRYAPSFFEGRGFLNETHPKVEELVDDIRGSSSPAITPSSTRRATSRVARFSRSVACTVAAPSCSPWASATGAPTAT